MNDRASAGDHLEAGESRTRLCARLRAGSALVVLAAAAFLLVSAPSAFAAGVTVTLAGGGAGTVTSSPTGIDCSNTGGGTPGPTCNFTFPPANVTLTASPDAGSVFTGWTGTSGSGTCQSGTTNPCNFLSLLNPVTVTATFEVAETPPEVAIDDVLESEITGTEATFHGTVDPNGSALTACRFEWVRESDPNGFSSGAVKSAPCDPDPGSGDDPVEVSATATNLDPSTAYRVRLLADKQTTDEVTAEAAPFTTDVIPPQITEMMAVAGATMATLRGWVNARNSTTHWSLEYRPGGTSEWIVATQGEAEGNSPVGVVARLLGLEPHSSYEFRIVAESAVGEAVVGPEPFTTGTPPPDRGYELVSPPDKNDGELGAGFAPGEGGGGQYFASPDGNHLAYTALGGFADASSNGTIGAYAATRGEENWSSTSLLLGIAPEAELLLPAAPAISSDFSRALTTTNLDVDTGEVASAVSGGFTYLLDVATRDVELFTVPDQGDKKTYRIDNRRLAGNDDFSRIVYTAEVDLLNDGLPANASRVYLYDNGSRKLVSVLPSGDPTAGVLAESHRRPVSSNANVAYFLGQGVNPGLYRRDIAAGQTSRVNADENSGEEPPPANATFSGASANGDIAYFISNQRLVDEDTDSSNDLYRYDHSKPEGERLTLISVDRVPGDGEADVQASHGVSADGQTVMFTASNQLVAGEPTDAGSKLYAYTDGELRYVSPSTLTASSSADRNSRLAEDGEMFAWSSDVSGITPEDNGDLNQVYVYDVAEDEVFCASCRPGGPNTAAASIQRPASIDALVSNFVPRSAPRRAVSDEGHVFFQTAEALLPRDTNGNTDVYVWQDGELDLVSTGRSGDDSWFLDASVDGSTVFFSTREQLSGWDKDNRIDAYAARTGDTLPEPSKPGAPCVGDDCQGPPPLPPAFRSPASNDGARNLNADPVSCRQAERNATRLAKRARRQAKKAKRLIKRARKVSGVKAKHLRQRAKQTRRKAKQTRQEARRADNRLALCRKEAEL